MAITSNYLISVGKLGEMLSAVRNAQAPDRFTMKFLQGLGYKSTNDRLFIGMLKALGFLDANGVPQQRYFDFLDEARSRSVLAEGIQAAYEDLFRLNKKAYELTQEQVKGKLKSLTQGQVSAPVLRNMARTFVELAKNADFNGMQTTVPPAVPEGDQVPDETDPESSPEGNGNASGDGRFRKRLIDALAYRVEIVLPATRDRAIYDAIFRSLKDHLL